MFPTAMYCEYCYLSITFIAQLQESTGKTLSTSQHLFEPPHCVMELTFSSRLGIQCMWKALQNLPKQIYFSSNSTESNLQSGELNKHMPFAVAFMFIELCAICSSFPFKCKDSCHILITCPGRSSADYLDWRLSVQCNSIAMSSGKPNGMYLTYHE
mgnify:CR=1 FL=1